MLNVSNIAIITVIIVVLFITLLNLTQLILLKNSEDRGFLPKKYCFKFQSNQGSFFYFFIFFCFATYKMVDSEYSMDIYKTAKISIGTVMRVPFVRGHFKIKKMCKHAVKNYLIY